MAGSKGVFKASGISALRDKPNLRSRQPVDFKAPAIRWNGSPLSSRYAHAGYRNVIAVGHSGMAGGGADDGSTHGWGHELAAMLGARFQNYARGGAAATFQDQTGSDLPGGPGQNGSGGWAQVLYKLSFPHPSKNWAIPNNIGWPGSGVSPIYPLIRPAQANEPFVPPPWLPLIFYGNNDLGFLQYSGGSPNWLRNLNAFLDAMRTIISRCTAAAVFEELDSSCTFGSSWGALLGQGFGLLSGSDGRGCPTSSGSDAAHTLTIQVPSDLLYGDTVALGFSVNPGASGQVQVNVDGSSAGLPNGGAIPFSNRTSLPKMLYEQSLGIVYRIPGLSSGRTAVDGVISGGSLNQVSSVTLGVGPNDVGRLISGTNILPNTTITGVSGTTVTMSQNATGAVASGGWVQVGHIITVTVTTACANVYFDYWQVEAGNAFTRSPVTCVVPSLFKPMSYALWPAPLPTDVDVEGWNDAYKAMIDAEFPGALWVDLVTAVPRTDSPAPWWIADLTHPSDAGHQVIAGRVFDSICDRAQYATAGSMGSKAKDLTSPREGTTYGTASPSGVGIAITSTTLVDVPDVNNVPFDLWLPASPGDVIKCQGRFLVDGTAGTPGMRGDIAVMSWYVGAPGVATIALAAGGSLTVGTQYYYWLSGLNARGESVASGPCPAPLPTAGNQSVTLTFYVPVGMTQVKVYRTTAVGYPSAGSNLLTTLTPAQATTATFTDTGSAASAGFPPTISRASGNPFRVLSGVATNNYGTAGYGGLIGYAPAATWCELFPVPVEFVVLPGDVVNGGVLLRPQCKLDSAGSRLIWSGGNDAWFTASNKGRQGIYADRAV